jgi:hypothetical protein
MVFTLKMFKYIKIRPCDVEDGENESELSEPSMSRAEKEVSDKKNRLYNDTYLAIGFTRTGDENCLHLL